MDPHRLNLRRWTATLKAYVSALRRKPITRDLDVVLLEYQDTWGNLAIRATRLKCVEDFFRIVGDSEGPELHVKNQQLVWGLNDVSRHYIHGIETALRENFGSFSSVLEFGSGSGRNLLYLKRKNPALNVQGYELTRPGARLAGRLAKKFRLPIRVRQQNLWHLQGGPEADVGFTCFALEQVNCDVPKAALLLKKILSKVRRGVVLLEPLVEYYPRTLRGWFARIEHKKIGYCSTIGQACEKLAREGRVNLCRLPYPDSHNPLMFPQMIILTKTSSKTAHFNKKKLGANKVPGQSARPTSSRIRLRRQRSIIDS